VGSILKRNTMAPCKQLILHSLVGFDLKGRLRWGFLLSVLLSVLGSLHPTSSVYRDMRPSTHKMILTKSQYEHKSTHSGSQIRSTKVLALSLRGGSEMGLTVQNQGPVDLDSIVPALMSTDNAIRSQAEVTL
jgi:hypothetical protein